MPEAFIGLDVGNNECDQHEITMHAGFEDLTLLAQRPLVSESDLAYLMMLASL